CSELVLCRVDVDFPFALDGDGHDIHSLRPGQAQPHKVVKAKSLFLNQLWWYLSAVDFGVILLKLQELAVDGAEPRMDGGLSEEAPAKVIGGNDLKHPLMLRASVFGQLHITGVDDFGDHRDLQFGTLLGAYLADGQ